MLQEILTTLIAIGLGVLTRLIVKSTRELKKTRADIHTQLENLHTRLMNEANEQSNITISRFEEVKEKLLDYAKEFAPKSQTETEYRLAETKEELSIATSVIAGRHTPTCQFCGNVLGKVKRRADGYWCCQSCSVKQFGSISS